MQDPYQDQTTKIYDEWAHIFKKQTQNLEDFWWMLKKFQNFVKSWKILDLWCAYGRHMQLLENNGFDTYGIEVSSELIKLASPEIQKKITHGSMLDVCEIYKRKSFNGIISSASIVHINKNIWVQVLQSAYSLLKSKGYLYFAFIVKISPLDEETGYKWSKTIPGIEKKYVYYSEEEMNNILEKIGFEVKSEHIHTPYSDTWKTVIAQKF